MKTKTGYITIAQYNGKKVILFHSSMKGLEEAFQHFTGGLVAFDIGQTQKVTISKK